MRQKAYDVCIVCIYVMKNFYGGAGGDAPKKKLHDL